MEIPAFIQRSPLASVVMIALALRLIAVFAAPGYLMVDDQFLVVEPAASWASGADHNNWLPWNMEGEKKPHAANFSYVGTQYFVFEAMNAIGMEDPKAQMVVVRLLHALYSLLIVVFGFKITARLGNERTATYVGLFLAAAAIMPNFSVRQLVEIVCIPPMLLATWAIVRTDGKPQLRDFLLAGLGIGLATGLRYQAGVFGIGFGLVLLFQRQFKGAVVTGVFALVIFALTQIQDVFIWGKPFTQLLAYIGYNESHSSSYPNGPWYMYLLTLLGYLVPPLSVFLLYGFFASVRRYPLVVLPALAFLVFHSAFPNKQERFIFPILPFVVIAGVLFWDGWMASSAFWKRRRGLWRGLLYTFLVINTAGLVVLTTTYGKRSRVESMYALYKAGDLENFIAVYTKSEPLPPRFYSGQWERNYWCRAESDPQLQLELMCGAREHRTLPNYLLIYGGGDVDAAIERFAPVFGLDEPLAIVQPGFLDRILHMLNPNNNTLETVYIYRTDLHARCGTP